MSDILEDRPEPPLTPFRHFCIELLGPQFSAQQAADVLGVSRDTVRSWLKREMMPAAISIAAYHMRLKRAVSLTEGVMDRLEPEDQHTVHVQNRSFEVGYGPPKIFENF